MSLLTVFVSSAGSNSNPLERLGVYLEYRRRLTGRWTSEASLVFWIETTQDILDEHRDLPYSVGSDREAAMLFAEEALEDVKHRMYEIAVLSTPASVYQGFGKTPIDKAAVRPKLTPKEIRNFYFEVSEIRKTVMYAAENSDWPVALRPLFKQAPTPAAPHT